MREFLRQTRVRMTLAYTAVFTLITTLAAVGFWVAFSQTEYGSVDSSLSAQTQALATGLDEANGRVTFHGNDSLPGQTNEGIAVAAILVSADGTVLDRSGEAPAAGAVMPQVRRSRASASSVSDTTSIAGHRQRVLVTPMRLASLAQVSLVVTRTIDELDRTLARTALFLALGVVALAVVGSGAGYWLAGRALRPVRQIAATARELSERDLHRRIDLALPDDELGELADTFNGMLARLEAAFESLRRFTADAAHDLRAPLSILLLEVDVAMKRPRTPAGYKESLEAVRSEAERLSRMVDQLLLLARADSGALSAQLADVDISDLLEETVSRWQPLAKERGVQLVTELPDAGVLRADPDLLQRLVDNLIDNAIRYTPRDGTVTVACAREDGSWRLTVADTGRGVDEALKPTLFDRFTRADPARTRETGGAGLGLSLCAVVARLHGGGIALEDSGGPGATFAVRLPA